MIPPKQAFVPLRLTPESRRFERFPGEVIDVLPQEELNKVTLRCSPNPTSAGTVRDVMYVPHFSSFYAKCFTLITMAIVVRIRHDIRDSSIGP